MEMVKKTMPLFPALPQEAQIIVGGDGYEYYNLLFFFL
jgi:hypothetical protein